MKTGWLGRIRNLDREVLGMNARNLDFIYRFNRRPFFPRVDDKLITKEFLDRAGIPHPATLAVFRNHHDAAGLAAVVKGCGDFVIKPATGSGGKGILPVRRSNEGDFLVSRHGSECRVDAAFLTEHVIDILAGRFALERNDDTAFFEELLEADDVLGALSWRGLPDIRIIVAEGRAVMAMLRLPTRDSNGKANLHQGAIGVGIGLEDGVTNTAVRAGRPLKVHPDTGIALAGVAIPEWKRLKAMAVQSAECVELGFIGADLAIDRRQGPVIIELNARPGLAIQLANRTGLAQLLYRSTD